MHRKLCAHRLSASLFVFSQCIEHRARQYNNALTHILITFIFFILFSELWGDESSQFLNEINIILMLSK